MILNLTLRKLAVLFVPKFILNADTNQSKSILRTSILLFSVTLLHLNSCKKTYNTYNCPPDHKEPGYQVTTLAGDTAAGFINGNAAAARFNAPGGIAVDANGNVFVTDINNNVVRMITSKGVTSVYGNNSQIKFQYPLGLATNGDGNVYVADTFNHRICKIDRNGVITIIAGDGTSGFANGIGTAAKFYYPTDIAIDATGNLYVFDAFNLRIRKITPIGVVTTFAGSGKYGNANGPAATAEFTDGLGIAVDDVGNVYVSDPINSQVRKISNTGIVSTFAGDGTAGYRDGSNAQFNNPLSLATDHKGNVYVSDFDNNRIRMINPAGVVSTIAGGDNGLANGPALKARFNGPRGVILDATGNIYVADQKNNQVRKISVN
ncbi:NHL repeat-containing protein [Mucilaginibacter sp. UYCu711]|uniref:NHL repeat-containing protein n=1 Tax=Mucilaginibacter sp. UYCu711 TaxID=3156339 RepID=UPI003D1B0F32